MPASLPAETRVSRALEAIIRPAAFYDRAVSSGARGTWAAALKVPVLLAVLLGIVTSIAAAQRLTVSLVFSQALWWSFVPALQLLTGALLVASAPRRRVDVLRAIELLFAGHGAWSLWLLVFAAAESTSAGLPVLLASAVAALGVTARVTAAFAGHVLGVSPRSGRIRVFVHQAATVAVILIYIELSTALSVRLLPFVR